MSTGTGSHRERSTEGDNESANPDALAEVFTRFTFGSDRHRRRESHSRRQSHNRRQSRVQYSPRHAEIPEPTQASWPTQEPSEIEQQAEIQLAEDAPEVQYPEEELSATYIRPYAWTGGRTKSNHRFELETLVSTTELCQTTQLERLEHLSVAELCRHPRSVAEVGAVLRVPLGVARVLLGDMADLGLIIVHGTVLDGGSASHLLLMEKVLSGLRRL